MNTSSTLSLIRILLVENNESVRDSLSLAFKKAGCTIKSVESAEKAVKALRKGRFEIIISDFSLPEYDGIAFFKLKDTFPKNSLKILISTEVSKDMIKKSKAAGVHEVIEKPFKFKKIIGVLVTFLSLNQPKG